MGKDLVETKDIEDIAQQAHAGIDISEHFTGQFQAKQNIDVVLPVDLLKLIDSECKRQNISRKDWISAACSEKIHQTQSGTSGV